MCCSQDLAFERHRQALRRRRALDLCAYAKVGAHIGPNLAFPLVRESVRTARRSRSRPGPTVGVRPC